PAVAARRAPLAGRPATGSTGTTLPDGPTLADVAAHATSEDCWLAIGGNAYDVTAYLTDHPGGSRTITPFCGLEATEAFATEDGRGEHSEEAVALLADYLVGALVG
ncbi:MAG: cytochrome b5 domain-containing protein, partial [Acidimicrobiales bacterium]|nr:cytochrome b5 domain-containing protein [Acidimicrobiales bacterium]